MTVLFNREASVLIQSKGDPDLKIEGLRISFDVEKFFGETMNAGEIRIYNLNPENRRRLTKRKADFASGPFTTVTLIAGYPDEFGVIFKGNLVQGISTRKGPDWITSLTGYTSFDQHLSAIHKDNDTWLNITAVQLLNLLLGTSNIAPPGLTSKDTVFFNTNWGEAIEWDREEFLRLNALKVTGFASAGRVLRAVVKILRRYNLRVTPDDLVVYITKERPSIKPINPTEQLVSPLLSPETGLLGSPVITEIGVELKTILNHDIRVTKLFRVQSETTQQNDLRNEPIQTFTCIKVTHSGDTHSTAWESNVSGVWFPDLSFTGTKNKGPRQLPETFGPIL